jgi:hypothetical protein
MQDEHPVACYSKKLNSAQMNYATIDKELLCVVATLREFRSMLFGAELHIHTDHRNILNVGDSSEHRLRWTSYVDDKKINYLINYHKSYHVQLGQTRVFLIAVCEHSKAAAGRLEKPQSGLKPRSGLSLWYQSNRDLGSIGKPVTGYLCSLRHISPYWESVASVWLPKALV